MPDTGYDEPEPDLAGLRRELRETLVVPEFADLRRRARRRRRHRLAVSTGVALAVVAVLAGSILLTPRHPSSRVAGSGLTPHPTPSTDVRFGAWSTGGVALDAETPEGLLLQQRCATGGGLCEARVQLTADGGKTWHLGTPLPNDASGMLSSGLSPVVVNPALFALIDGDGQPALVSFDAGRTWQTVRVGMAVVPPVAAIDDGARWYVTLNQPVHGADAPAGNTVLAYDLAAKTEAPLAHQPPVPQLTSVRAQGMRIWAAGRDFFGLLVAISDDGGRTWRRHRLPGSAVDAVEIADVHGAHAVLLGHLRVDGDRWNVPDPLSALWTTRDGGATFTLVPPGPGRPRWVSAALVLSDGRIVLVADGAPIRLEPHRTHTASPGSPPPVTPTFSTQLLVSGDGGRTYDSGDPVDGLFELARIPGTDDLYGVASTGSGAPGGPVVLIRFHHGVHDRQGWQLP